MKQVFALVEGYTEEAFFRDTLCEHLERRSCYIEPVIVESARGESGEKYKGGSVPYRRFKKELMKLLRTPSAVVTMMLDYYALSKDYPGFQNRPKQGSPYALVGHLEDALRQDVDNPRFIPYLSLHEFEALVLVSPREIAATFQDAKLSQRFEKIISGYSSTEEINDGTQTHPSARIEQIVPLYRKNTHGPQIVQEIGLDVLRQKCPHFGQWLKTLEELADR